MTGVEIRRARFEEAAERASRSTCNTSRANAARTSFILFVANDADFGRVMHQPTTTTVRNPSAGEQVEVSFASVDPDVIDMLPNWEIEDPEFFVRMVTKHLGLTGVGEIEALGEAEDMLC